ncbi:MAG: 3-isopropylmalate dehydratase small subunit [Acetobacteraceae bacterium SCN 69-10]|nr:3-isopropylmalate dehydratase small subunit [Rhodospirillales bacterium]ODU55859.1 MAG: 3-isopropylmalate dehydratase small subunit [Acetobacteraceae bacterium SCN 69-10]OJY64891.1 MAG: 3-isopropylmalate dehydratase small subunit [Rhodospirillales bacterium 70-18]
MDKFTTLTGVAAPLPIANVDTDKIIPARFLKTIKRTGLGVHLFDTLRYDAEGHERPDFVLNQAPYRHAQILIAHENFGCGSSREHAPWALLDFGIRCVIAPDFADIFHTNTFKNGILPIRLPRAICDQLIEDARQGDNARITIDLAEQVVVRPNGEKIHFEIDPFRKHLLLNGLDDIGQTLQHAPSIDAYEAKQHSEKSWMPAITVG